MGNKQTKAVPLAILRDQKKKIYDFQDYIKILFCQDQIQCKLYKDFDQFIQKQSLKNLHNIMIVEDQVKEEQQQGNHKSYQQRQKQVTIAEYMQSIKKALSTTKKTVNLTTRQRIINYIKKYSLQYLNIFIYVQNFKDFVIPESQMSYITMVSTKTANIKHHILNQEKQKLISIKYKKLVKDLYRRKLVVIICKEYADMKKQEDKSKENQQKAKDKDKQKEKQLKGLKNLKLQPLNQSNNQTNPIKPFNLPPLKLKQFKIQDFKSNLDVITVKQMVKLFNQQQNRFDYEIVGTVQQLASRNKSMFPQFVICINRRDILQLIEYKKRMPIQSKIIFYGTENDLKNSSDPNQYDPLFEKKVKQIWWTSRDIQKQIVPVMRKWWTTKILKEKPNKFVTNVVVYLTKCENILKKKFIESEIKKEIQKLIAKQKQKLKQQNKQIPYQYLNLTVEYRCQEIFKRMEHDMYTVVLMFDASNEEFQNMKQIIMLNLRNQPRVQISLIQIKQSKKEEDQSKKSSSEQNSIKKGSKQPKNNQQILRKRILECAMKDKFQIKFAVSPVQSISCLNMSDDEHQFFQTKMGLTVNRIATRKQKIHEQVPAKKGSINKISQKTIQQQEFEQQQQNTNYLQYYMPKIKINYEGNNRIFSFELPKLLDNFYLICSFKDYVEHLLPYFMNLDMYLIDQKQFLQQTLNQEQKKSFIRQMKIVQNYYNRIKIILYGQIDFSQKASKTGSYILQQGDYSLNALYNIHSQEQNCRKIITRCVFKKFRAYFQRIQQKQNKQSKKQKKQSQEETINKQIKQKQEKTLLLDKIVDTIYKRFQQAYREETKNNPNIKVSEYQNINHIRLPNVDYVHYRLVEIQNYLNYCKYYRVSFSSFPKGSLKNFFTSMSKIQNSINAKSFSLQASFISSNDLLKKVFQKKNIQVSSKHRMQFVKFSLNKATQISHFEDYTRKFARLWKLNYDIFKKTTTNGIQFVEENLKVLKKDVIRSFKKCRNYDMLKITQSQFKHFYIDKIQESQTLLDLQIAIIYIYSLPHGMSDIVNAIYQEPKRSVLAIQIFFGFFLLMFINFISFQSSSMQKIQTVIYIEDAKMKKVYESLKQNQIFFNKNMLHLLRNQNQSENLKNHCIFIDYQNVPLATRSYISAILKIQRFAFYKESAQFLIAPFTKFRLKKKQLIQEKYKLYFQVVQQIQANIFLSQFFNINNINEIVLFNALNAKTHQKPIDQEIQETQFSTLNVQTDKNIKNQTLIKQTSFKKQKNIKKKKSKFQQTNTNLSLKISKQPQKASLYLQAEQMALDQQKQAVRTSIQVTLNYMKMLKSLKSNKLFSAQKYFTQIYLATLNEMKDNQDEDKKFEQVQQQLQLQKLRMQKAMLYVKMRKFTKALNQLALLKQFLIYQKIDDKDDWLKGKIDQMSARIQRAQIIRKNQLQKIPSTKKWTITMKHYDLNFGNLFQQIINKSDQASQNQKQSNQEIKYIQIQTPTTNRHKNNPNQRHQITEFIHPHEAQCEITIQPIKWRVVYQPNIETFQLTKAKTQNFQKETQKFQVFSLTKQAEDTQRQAEPDLQKIISERLLGLTKQTKPQINSKKNKQNKIINNNYQDFYHSFGAGYGMLPLKIFARFLYFKDSMQSQKQGQKIKQLSSLYTLQEFRLFFLTYFKQWSKQNTEANRQSSLLKQNTKGHFSRYNSFLIFLKKDYSPTQIVSSRVRLLQKKQQLQKLQRVQKNRVSQYGFILTTNVILKAKDCIRQRKQGDVNDWVDKQLNIKDKMCWSIMQLDGKMKIVDSKRKWKQIVQKGSKIQTNTFKRTENEILMNQKIKKENQRNDPNDKV